MERFTGVNKVLLYQLKLDFAHLFNEHYDMIEPIFEMQLADFNEFVKKPPQNFIGSVAYHKYKERIYASVRDTYIKLRLYPYVKESMFCGTRNLSIKAGHHIDRLLTGKEKKIYRDTRMDTFVNSVLAYTGLGKFKKDYDSCAKTLEVYSLGGKKVGDFDSEEEILKYLQEQKIKTLNKIEEVEITS